MVFPSLTFVTPYSSPKVSSNCRNWSKGLPSTRKFSWRARRMNCFTLREGSTSRGIWTSEELRRSFRKACWVPHLFNSLILPLSKFLPKAVSSDCLIWFSDPFKKAISGNITGLKQFCPKQHPFLENMTTGMCST